MGKAINHYPLPRSRLSWQKTLWAPLRHFKQRVLSVRARSVWCGVYLCLSSRAHWPLWIYTTLDWYQQNGIDSPWFKQPSHPKGCRVVARVWDNLPICRLVTPTFQQRKSPHNVQAFGVIIKQWLDSMACSTLLHLGQLADQIRIPTRRTLSSNQRWIQSSMEA